MAKLWMDTGVQVPNDLTAHPWLAMSFPTTLQGVVVGGLDLACGPTGWRQGKAHALAWPSCVRLPHELSCGCLVRFTF